MIRILIADDQAAVGAGFAALVAAEDDMEVIGETADGREARRPRPPPVPARRADGRAHDESQGLEATQLICGDPNLPGTRVLMLTTFDLGEYVYGVVRAGASYFLLNDAGPTELLHAIRTIAAGDVLLAPSITKRLLAEFANRRDPAARPPAALQLSD